MKLRSLHGYQPIDHLAWSGWRYRIPGGPVGGQYHGFIAPDSSYGGWPGGRSEKGGGEQIHPSGISQGPQEGSSQNGWDPNWGGTAFKEGQTHSDYLYRGPAEVRPRPNASGGTNVIRGHQTRRTPGYSVAPGTYPYFLNGLGMVMYDPGPISNRGMPMPLYPPARGGPVPYTPVAYTGPDMQRIPQRYLGPPTMIPSAGSGATSVVTQPAPPPSPAPVNVVYWTAPPTSPAPAPTVAASPADFLPSQGQSVPGISPAPAASDAVSSWLADETVIPGVKNQWIAIGGVLAAFLLMGGKGKR